MKLCAEIQRFHAFPLHVPRVNQQLIAKKLRLSRPTVSRSLANHPSISAETRRRVQEMAAELGYGKSPARTIRRSRQARPITLGVLIGTPLVASDRSTFPQILHGIQKRAAIEHATIDVLPLDSEALAGEAGQREILRHIRNADWRGVVLIYPFASETVSMLSEKLSAVSVLTEYHDQSVDVVDTDHDGVRTLVSSLAALGHKSIGFCCWHYPVGALWTSRRCAAYAEGILQEGLRLNPDWILNINTKGPRFETAEAVADRAVQLCRTEGVTAWVCAADHQAYQLIRDMRTRGLGVPSDCSVTGFDGNETPHGLPSLTTLGVPNEDIGASAVARLISRLLHPGSAQRKILVQTELIEGATMQQPRRT